MEATAATASPERRAWRLSWGADVAPVATVILLAAIVDAPRQREGPGIAAVLLALIVAVPLLWRRRHPLLVFCAVTVAVIGVARVIAYPSIAAALIAGYSLAAHDRRWWLSLGVVVTVAAIIGAVYPGPLPSIPDALGPFLVLLVPWVAGNGIRLRQQRVDTVESRARRLERERDDAESSMREQRTRIARELHDVVAHSVSVMVIQATAARQVVRSKPDRAAEALLAVEESGREALGELRHLLGLLAADGDSPLAPQPGLGALPALVERIRGAGLPVTLRVEGEPRHLPPGVDLAGYRIVQEALTNALKHAGGAPTEVVVTYAAGEVGVSVIDDGATVTGESTGDMARGTGQGLVGMRERAALYGGTLDAGPRPGGGYAVRARLPVPAE